LQASLPANGERSSLLASQQREGSCLVPGNALSGWPSRVELVEGLAAGIVPGLLPGNDKGQRGAAMIELPKMPVEGFS
jgi:hypothetical protein